MTHTHTRAHIHWNIRLFVCIGAIFWIYRLYNCSSVASLSTMKTILCIQFHAHIKPIHCAPLHTQQFSNVHPLTILPTENSTIFPINNWIEASIAHRSVESWKKKRQQTRARLLYNRSHTHTSDHSAFGKRNKQLHYFVSSETNKKFTFRLEHQLSGGFLCLLDFYRIQIWRILVNQVNISQFSSMLIRCWFYFDAEIVSIFSAA